MACSRPKREHVDPELESRHRFHMPTLCDGMPHVQTTACHSWRRLVGRIRWRGQKSYLENGHSTRHSDHMSTYCASAAPTRDPAGEGQRARVGRPAVNAVAAVGGAANGGLVGSGGGGRFGHCALLDEPAVARRRAGDNTTPADATTSIFVAKNAFRDRMRRRELTTKARRAQRRKE